MDGMIITRRKLLAGLSSFIATPAIIRVAQLMPVKALDDFEMDLSEAALENILASFDYGNSFTIETGAEFTVDFGKSLASVA